MIPSLHGIASSSRKSDPFIILVDNPPNEAGFLSFTIPTKPGLTYSYDVYWEQYGDPSNFDVAKASGDLTINFPVPDVPYIIKISGVFPAIYFNDTGSKQKIYDILQWGDINWQTMESAFRGCSSLGLFGYTANDVPILSNVTNMSNMFRDCTSFNGDISLWDTSNITNMDGMFLDSNFNQNIRTWCVSLIPTAPADFTSGSLIAQNTPFWGVCMPENPFRIKIDTSLSKLTQFNIPLNPVYNYAYDVYWEEVGNPSNNQLIINNVYSATNLHNVSFPSEGIYVLEIKGLFPHYYSPSTTGGLDNNFKLIDIMQWGDIVWQTMESAFEECVNLGQISATDSPNLTNVTSLANMFYNCYKFNGNLNNWNVSTITNMSGMFYTAYENFNGNITSWNVSNVTNMSSMFRSTPFNQDISNWNVSNVTNMSYMFSSTPFNQDISNWNVSSVNSMEFMFENATVFSQDLSGWCVALIPSEPFNFAENAGSWDLSSRPVWGTCPP